MLSSLLTQFRQRYPQGSLTSDLLTIHDGLYVVRVWAGVDGRVLASGLGAHTALELAEDRATTRALERLGLAIAQSPTLPQPAGLGPFGEAQAAGSPSPPLPGLAGAIAPPRSPEALEPEAPDAFAAAPVATPVSPRVAPPPLTLVSPTLGPGSAAKHPAADLPALGTPPWPQDPEPVPAASPETVGRPPNEFALGTDPGDSVDLSDIIAQTDVELQRLGWGVNQGREFLEKTYGKRSRHDLTDDELLEFLLFLETQPSPGSP